MYLWSQRMENLINIRKKYLFHKNDQTDHWQFSEDLSLHFHRLFWHWRTRHLLLNGFHSCTEFPKLRFLMDRHFQSEDWKCTHKHRQWTLKFPLEKGKGKSWLTLELKFCNRLKLLWRGFFRNRPLTQKLQLSNAVLRGFGRCFPPRLLWVHLTIFHPKIVNERFSIIPKYGRNSFIQNILTISCLFSFCRHFSVAQINNYSNSGWKNNCMHIITSCVCIKTLIIRSRMVPLSLLLNNIGL